MSDSFNPLDAEWVEEAAKPDNGFKLRPYQLEWIEETRKARAAGFTRLLLDACGGLGKTSFAAALAKEEWQQRRGRTLVLANREQLVKQTVDRLKKETGMDVDLEMAGATASPYSPIVVASVPTLGRVNRLTSFSADHFSLVICDEAHHSLSNLFLRIMNRHHYGDAALAEGWVAPKDGTYKPLACVIGITATPDLNGKKTLGAFYQKFVARFSYLRAIEEGWLVGVREENIPCKIDTRKFRKKNTSHGVDFSAEDESAAIIPIIEELADQITLLAINRKTMCFLPSLECAEKMASALNRKGLKALYVSGECLDKSEKTEIFQAHGSGICLCLCALYCEGTDFPDVDAVAWMRATLSRPFYIQGVYRMSRVLPGVINDGMNAEQRLAAIASSRKTHGLLISPFFVSEKINLMQLTDLFIERQDLRDSIKVAPKDMTDAAKIRDFIAALEKAADKHRNRQPRTIDPVRFGLAIGVEAIAHYQPETAQDAAPPTKAELDYLLEAGCSSMDVKTSGAAQLLIGRLQGRERLGLASPKMIQQLTLRLGWPQETASMMKQKQAGLLIGKGIRYRRPVERPTACYCNATSHPPCSFCESGAGGED